VKAKQVTALLKDSQEYREFCKLRNALQEKSGPLIEEERRAVFDAAEKVNKKFIEITNPTISRTLSCCKIHGNEGRTRIIYSERIKAFKLAILKQCLADMPDYYQFLEIQLPELWHLKNKKSKRSP